MSATIREHAKMVVFDERRIIERIISQQNAEALSSRDACQNEIKTNRARLTMLDKLIAKLYEDRLTGVVPEATFRSLIQKYERERVDRSQAAESLENKLQSIRQGADDASAWAKLIQRYAGLETLDAETLLLLVDKIIVEEPEVTEAGRVCNVKVVYNYVGDVGWLKAGKGKAVA